MTTAASISALNESCFCFPIHRRRLDAKILGGLANRVSAEQTQIFAQLLSERPNLFANTGVLLNQRDLDAMLGVVGAIEAITKLPDYRRTVFAENEVPELWQQTSAQGLLMGYDFHITDTGPALIEVNTNAGGAFLVEAMTAAVRQSNLELACAGARLVDFDESLVDIFRDEWRAGTGIGAQVGLDVGAEAKDWPQSIVIADETPEEQYLYPDMLLAQFALQERGVTTRVADIAALTSEQGEMQLDGAAVDLLYNRSTDFYFSDPSVRTLQNLTAGRAEGVPGSAPVVSPNPAHHALFADKRNLLRFSATPQLLNWGLAPEHATALQHVPHAEPVPGESAEGLWQRRKKLFFKPAAGYGSKAVYRGDRLTKKVWQQLTAEDSRAYIAQDLVPPAKRGVIRDAAAELLKYDVRIYTYAGRPLLAAARVYQGQTTNFRTQGGGFAPLFLC